MSANDESSHQNFHCRFEFIERPVNKSPDDSAYFKSVSDAAKFMLDNDHRVTLNTDDPGILNLKLLADIDQLAQPYLGLSKSDIVQLAKNSFEFFCIDPTRKDRYMNRVGMFEQAWLWRLLNQIPAITPTTAWAASQTDDPDYKTVC